MFPAVIFLLGYKLETSWKIKKNRHGNLVKQNFYVHTYFINAHTNMSTKGILWVMSLLTLLTITH